MLCLGGQGHAPPQEKFENYLLCEQLWKQFCPRLVKGHVFSSVEHKFELRLYLRVRL